MNNYALPEGTSTLDGDLVGHGRAHRFRHRHGAVGRPGRRAAGARQRRAWHDVIPARRRAAGQPRRPHRPLTNDRWLSTLHRVKPPVVDGTIARRRSAAFFHDGNVDAVVAPLAGCVAEEPTTAYEPMTVRDHIAAKLAGSRQGRKNTAAVREAARVLAADG